MGRSWAWRRKVGLSARRSALGADRRLHPVCTSKASLAGQEKEGEAKELVGVRALGNVGLPRALPEASGMQSCSRHLPRPRE